MPSDAPGGNIAASARVRKEHVTLLIPDLNGDPKVPIFLSVLLCTMRLRHALAFAALLAAPLRADATAPVVAASVAEAPVVTLEFTRGSDTRAFRLSAPRPNPFATQTRFEITLDEADQITVAVHDALGRRVALLQDGAARAGTYTLTLNANALPPGLYLIRATDGHGVTATRSVALVR